MMFIPANKCSEIGIPQNPGKGPKGGIPARGLRGRLAARSYLTSSTPRGTMHPCCSIAAPGLAARVTWRTAASMRHFLRPLPTLLVRP